MSLRMCQIHKMPKSTTTLTMRKTAKIHLWSAGSKQNPCRNRCPHNSLSNRSQKEKWVTNYWGNMPSAWASTITTLSSKCKIFVEHFVKRRHQKLYTISVAKRPNYCVSSNWKISAMSCKRPNWCSAWRVHRCYVAPHSRIRSTLSNTRD